MDKYITAFNTFKLKYNCLPGDCLNATSLFSGAVNGNGNGKIEGIWADGEVLQVWYQLAAANLISGNYTGVTIPASYPVAGINEPPGILKPLMCYTIAWWPATWWGATAFGGGEIWTPSQNARASGNAILLTKWDNAGANYGHGGGLTADEAYRIDKKIDDGRPGLGKIILPGNSGYPNWGKDPTQPYLTYVDTTDVTWAAHWRDPAIIYYNLGSTSTWGGTIQYIDPF